MLSPESSQAISVFDLAKMNTIYEHQLIPFGVEIPLSKQSMNTAELRLNDLEDRLRNEFSDLGFKDLHKHEPRW